MEKDKQLCSNCKTFKPIPDFLFKKGRQLKTCKTCRARVKESYDRHNLLKQGLKGVKCAFCHRIMPESNGRKVYGANSMCEECTSKRNQILINSQSDDILSSKLWTSIIK